MIKKLLSIALIAGFVSANAQQFKLSHAPGKTKSGNQIALRGGPNSGLTSVVDTLYPVTYQVPNCGVTGPNYYYPIDVVAPIDTGYVFGTNTFPYVFSGVTYTVDYTEAAQKYNIVGAATVTDVLVLAGKAYSSAGTTLVTAKIYSENTTSKAPSAQLGSTSTGTPLNTFSTTAFNTLTFATPVAVNNQNFFASVVSPPLGGTTMDTLGIIGTEAGVCSSTDSLAWGYYTITAPGGAIVATKWSSAKVLFGGANLDLAIFPVININTTGINNHVSKGGLNLYAASPNPASNSININFSLNNASKVDIEVYDLTGKVVRSIKGTETFSNTGKHAVSIDLGNLDSGSYMYSINANGNKMFSKFVVAK